MPRIISQRARQGMRDVNDILESVKKEHPYSRRSAEKIRGGKPRASDPRRIILVKIVTTGFPRYCIFLLLSLLLLAMIHACSSGGKKTSELLEKAVRQAERGSHWYERGCYTKAEKHFAKALELNRPWTIFPP